MGHGHLSLSPDAASPTPFCAASQVSGRCHLIRLPWARVARPTPRLAAQEAAPAALLRRLTTAPARGALGEAPCAVPERREQEPARRPSAPARGDPCEREDVVGSLVGMGFSPVQADALLAVQPGTSPQQLLDIVSELVLLGLNPEPVYAALRRSPQVLSLPVAQMRRRAGYLRKLGLGEGEGPRGGRGAPLCVVPAELGSEEPGEAPGECSLRGFQRLERGEHAVPAHRQT